jgi:hypothetical protein
MLERFSQIYLDRGAPTRDSERFRRRLSAYFVENFYRAINDECVKKLTIETGVGNSVLNKGRYGGMPSVFEHGEPRDVLDAITAVFSVLIDEREPEAAQIWRTFVARVMHEENVGYRVDSQCVAHYHVDQEFERNRASTLTALERVEFAGIKASFEDAFRHLDADPQDTKAAVRSMFEAVESIAKLMVPGQGRLTRNLCVQKLKDACISVLCW